MTDQMIPADKVRPILDEWERIKEYADWDDLDTLVKDIRALLPAPPLPTLADMNEEERRASRWMQADVANVEARPVIVNPHWQDGIARVMWPGGIIERTGWEKVTPRPDLPGMEWAGSKRPAPTLPDGWRVADHKDNGRVIVTTPVPARDGRVYYVIPSDTDDLGFDWLFCDADELTYIDQ